MSAMRIGDICTILRIKTHILRYWEHHLPSLKPQQNAAGHRIYSEQDLALLLRFKYLIYHKMHTIEGAAKIIRSEEMRRGSQPESTFHILRLKLLRLLGRLKYQERILNSMQNKTDNG